MTQHPVRAVLGVLLTMALLLTALAAPAFAADGDKKGKAKQGKAKQDETQQSKPTSPVANVKGKQLKIAKAQVAKNWTRFSDPEGDQMARDGSPLPGEEPWTDLTSVSVVSSAAAVKMLRVMAEDHPVGAVDSYYGVDADWRPGQDAFYIVAQTAGKLPRDRDPDVQLIVTFDGDEAVPMQVNSVLGPYAGAETFSLSGPRGDGTWASGTTSLGGWNGSSDLPFYNGPSRDMGYYDRKKGAFMHVARLPKDATSATVTLWARGEEGEVFDELSLPSGGRFIGLGSPAWGLDVKKGAAPLACRRLETFSAGSADAADLDTGTSLIRYTVGWGDDSDVADAIAGLGSSAELELASFGSDDEPGTVDAAVALDAATNSATFSAVVPDGRWLLQSVDAELKSPGGQSVVDLRPLIGSAGVLTAPGLDGHVAGDIACGSLGPSA